MNKELLVGILTSGKPEKLERCLQSVNYNSSPHKQIVICNTQNSDYVSQAFNLSKKYGFDFLETESNGTPGKGKNSLLDYFVSTDCEYLFPVDADDYILPFAIDILSSVIEKNRPDAVCLVGGDVLKENGQYIKFPLIKEKSWVRNFFTVRNKTNKKNQTELIKKYFSVLLNTSEKNEGLNRLILLHRDIANRYKYDEKLLISEDVLYHINLKNQNIKYMALESNSIYVYDISDEGIVVETIKENLMEKNISYFLKQCKQISTESLDYVDLS